MRIVLFFIKKGRHDQIAHIEQGHENPWLETWTTQYTGPRFNIKMSSYQYRKSHCGDKTVVRSSYLHYGISYTSKMSSLYWIRALVS